MFVLQIENVKEFMIQLFQGDLFDAFCVSGCEVSTFITFLSDGRVHKEWFDTDEREQEAGSFVRWKLLKPLVFSLIRGKKTPGQLKIDFCHYFPDGDMGSLRVLYEEDKLLVYSGYMQHEFSLDKGKQQSWDEECEKFFKKNKIVSTHIE